MYWRSFFTPFISDYSVVLPFLPTFTRPLEFREQPIYPYYYFKKLYVRSAESNCIFNCASLSCFMASFSISAFLLNVLTNRRCVAVTPSPLISKNLNPQSLLLSHCRRGNLTPRYSVLTYTLSIPNAGFKPAYLLSWKDTNLYKHLYALRTTLWI